MSEEFKLLSDHHLSTKVSDEFVRGEPMWVVDLNTGERVYREQIDGKSDSWLRLKEYLSKNPNQYITGLYFRFRDHWEEVGRDKDGFFFTNGISCWYGGSPIPKFIGGYHENGKIKVKKYSVPELLKEEIEEEREITDPTVQDGLIWRNQV